MSLRPQFNERLKEAMKAKDQRRVSTLRLILAALKDRDIAARDHGNMDGIGDDEIMDMLGKMVRQRRESITMYQQGGRPELAQQEEEEIAIISHFLPKQMTDGEIDQAVAEAIAALNAVGLKDMGRVMAALKERYAGQIDMGKAGTLVKQRLT